MKKLILSVFAAAAFLSARSQSLQLLDTATQASAQASYNWWVGSGDSYNETFYVKNHTSSAVTFMVKKYVYANPGSLNDITFCIGTFCYGASVTQSGNITIAANGTLPSGQGSYGLSTDFDAGSASGTTSQVRYSLINVNNAADSISVLINYNIGVSGIKPAAANYSISNIAPNPAKESVTLNYDIKNAQNASVKIYNMIGNLVKTVQLDNVANSAKIDVSTLEEGMYFYSVMVGNKAVKTSRLIIER